MKRLLNTLLVIISLGLCAVCLVQWQRETRLRGHIGDLVKRLEAENGLRIDAERKVRLYEKEIARLTELRAEVEAKLLEVTREYNDLSKDSVARGITIAIYMRELMQLQRGLEATQLAFGKGSEAIKNHNSVVASQNSAMEKQNELLKQLVEERNDAISKLNARTREFNELVEKYNKLAKGKGS
jgi:chromosome segregation ATPase